MAKKELTFEEEEQRFRENFAKSNDNYLRRELWILLKQSCPKAYALFLEETGCSWNGQIMKTAANKNILFHFDEVALPFFRQHHIVHQSSFDGKYHHTAIHIMEGEKVKQTKHDSTSSFKYDNHWLFYKHLFEILEEDLK